MLRKITRVLMLALLLFHSGYLPAQTNTYFENFPYWQITMGDGSGTPCIVDERFNYYIKSDTLINGRVYKPVYKKGYGTYSWFAPPPATPGCNGDYSYTNDRPGFFLRSEGKRMYICTPGNLDDELLYDFDLSVGDTLPLTYNNQSTSVTVTAIDSIQTQFGYLKRLKLFGDTWAEYLIEGVGHTRGLIEPMQVPVNYGYTLECYALDGSSYYPTIGLVCDVNVGLENVPERFTTGIAPNPFNTTAVIRLNKTLISAELRVYNAFGQLVSVTHHSGNNITLERRQLDAGIYQVVLECEGRVILNDKVVIGD